MADFVQPCRLPKETPEAYGMHQVEIDVDIESLPKNENVTFHQIPKIIRITYHVCIG